MDGARVEVTFVPHGFEVDVWQDSDKPSGQERVAGYCFDFGSSYKPAVLAHRLALFVVGKLRKEPNWLCHHAIKD